MPRVRRRGKHRRAGIEDRHVRQLLTGADYLCNAFGDDLDAMRAAWADLRDELLSVWIQAVPGTRPWAWWLFDAPPRRERADGGVHPFDDPSRENNSRTCRLHYGVTAVLVRREDCGIVYETQLAYLRRLGLLLPEEQSAPELPADWRPSWPELKPLFSTEGES